MELLLVSTWDRESLDGRKAVCGHMSQGPSSTHSEFDIDLNQFLSSPFFFSLGLEKSQDLESDDYPPHTHTLLTPVRKVIVLWLFLWNFAVIFH